MSQLEALYFARIQNGNFNGNITCIEKVHILPQPLSLDYWRQTWTTEKGEGKETPIFVPSSEIFF